MNLEWIRQQCLALPGATEQVQWDDDLVFKVGARMFAAAPLHPGAPVRPADPDSPLAPWFSFKCTPEEFAELVDRPGIRPAAYLARAHWVSLESPDSVSSAEAARLLRQSYELVVAKLPAKARHALPAPPLRPKVR